MKVKIITLFIITFYAFCISAQVIHVPSGQPNIQAGINAAANGDTVLVANGTYYENINFTGKAITVASNFIISADTNDIINTIIDGSQPAIPDSASVVYFISGEDTNSVIQGFTITGGKGTILPTTRRGGGGILCYYSGAKIINNYIERDTIFNSLPGVNILGGGLYYFADGVWGDHLVIKHNKFRWNYLHNNNLNKGALGAAYLIACDATIIGNEITYNTAESFNTKAAAYCITPPVKCRVKISGNIISHNKSIGVGLNSHAFGSGIYIIGCSGSIDNNIISYNEIVSAESSHGAILTWKTDTFFVIEKNVIKHNTVTSYGYSLGGGISLIYGTAKIINNLIYDNDATYGGGIAVLDTLPGSTRIINNTIVKNHAEYGGSIYNRSDSIIILNSILWDNVGWILENEILDLEGGYTKVMYSDVKTTTPMPGLGNINNDPLFVDPQNGDFHLTVTSPCTGSGIDSVGIGGDIIYCPLTDFENDPRPMPSTLMPDMGADEVDELVGYPAISQNVDPDNFFSIYPNPFTVSITIEYESAISGNTKIAIFNHLGQQIKSITLGNYQAGKQQYVWDASGLPNGIYFVRVKAGEAMTTSKIVKLR